MRAILVDWLIEIHHQFRLRTETLHIAINYLDRFLCKVVIKRANLQLVGVTGLLVCEIIVDSDCTANCISCIKIASKFEEVHPLEVEDLVFITATAYTRAQILE